MTKEENEKLIESDCYKLIKALVDLLIALKRFDKWEKTK